MKRFFYTIFALAALAFPARAQWAQPELGAGLHVVFRECDTCAAVTIDVDTLHIFSASRFLRVLDSLATARGWGASGGVRIYLTGGFPLDSGATSYSLFGYMHNDYTVLDGNVTLFGSSPDSQKVNWAQGLTTFFGFAGRPIRLEYFAYVPGYVNQSYSLHRAPPLGADSMYQAHVTYRSGSYYFGVYHVPITAGPNPPISAGRCVAQEQICCLPLPGTGSWGFKARLTTEHFKRDP